MRLVTHFTLATLTHIKFCLPTFEQTLSDQDFRFHFRGWHIPLPRLPLKQGVLVGGAIQSTGERMQLYFAMNLMRMFSHSPDNGIFISSQSILYTQRTRVRRSTKHIEQVPLSGLNSVRLHPTPDPTTEHSACTPRRSCVCVCLYTSGYRPRFSKGSETTITAWTLWSQYAPSPCRGSDSSSSEH